MTKPKPRCKSPPEYYGGKWNFLGIISDGHITLYDLWLNEDNKEFSIIWPENGGRDGHLRTLVANTRKMIENGRPVAKWRLDALSLIDEYLNDPSVSPNAQREGRMTQFLTSLALMLFAMGLLYATIKIKN